MKSILNRKILIKNHPKKIIYIPLVFSIIFSYIVSLKLDISILLTFEQTIFVILSAILFVFHESIIGYSTISKIRNKINEYKKNNIKLRMLSFLNKKGASKNYDDFLVETERDIVNFSKGVEEFKRKSYRLYIIFTIFGFLVIVVSLISSDSLFINFLLNDTVTLDKLSRLKVYLLNFFIFGQFFTIPIWIISAYQAQQQKNEIINFFDIENISGKLKEYIQEKNLKNIELEL